MSGPRIEGQPEYFNIPQETPKIVDSLDFSELANRIRNIKLLDDSIKGLLPYRSSTISLEKVRIVDLNPCALYVLKQNLEIQRQLRRRFLSIGIDTLNLKNEQALISFSWGDQQGILTPPIVEVSEDDNFINVITDGLHRVSIGQEEGEEEISVLMIKNTAVPLAVLPVGWEEVRRVDSVPPIDQKRRMRFDPSEDMFRWFGLSKRNIERLVGGFEEFNKYSYRALFRDLRFEESAKTKLEIPQVDIKEFGINSWGEKIEFSMTKSECLRKYTSAGFIVTSSDGSEVLLGNHHEDPSLWGNFAGSRELGENDSKITAARELYEELGLKLGADFDFGDPFIVINKKSDGSPRAGIIYSIRIDKNMNLNIPPDSEIKSVKWFSVDDILELIDFDMDIQPYYSMWGGEYTYRAIEEFMEVARGKRKFGGMYEVLTGYGGTTPYEEIKRKEKLELSK